MLSTSLGSDYSVLDQTAGYVALRHLSPFARPVSVQAAPAHPHLSECCFLPHLFECGSLPLPFRGVGGFYLAHLLGQRWDPPWTESLKHMPLDAGPKRIGTELCVGATIARQKGGQQQLIITNGQQQLMKTRAAISAHKKYTY